MHIWRDRETDAHIISSRPFIPHTPFLRTRAFCTGTGPPPATPAPQHATSPFCTWPARGGGDRLGSGPPHKIIHSPKALYKAPKDYTKPQSIIQSPFIPTHTIPENTAPLRRRPLDGAP